MIDKIEKDGSYIICLSDMTTEEAQLLKLIDRFISGDMSVIDLSHKSGGSKPDSPSLGKPKKKKYYNFASHNGEYFEVEDKES